MLRATAGLVLAVGLLVGQSPAAAAPVRSSTPASPVVYLPGCDESAIVPAVHRPGPDCPQRSRTELGADCFVPSPGDYAAPPTPADPRQGLLPSPAPAPPAPERVCLEVVPAAPAATARR